MSKHQNKWKYYLERVSESQIGNCSHYRLRGRIWQTPDTREETKSSVFWDVTSFSLLQVSRRFGGTCHPHLHDRHPATCFHVGWLGLFFNLKVEATALLSTSFHCGFLLGLVFNPEDGGDMFLQNVV
jgi:hypothetical protein